MSIEGDDIAGRVKYVTKTMKVMIAAILFFLIPVAVARNVSGIGDKLSILPGIAKGGGVVSGFVAAIYIIGAVAIVAGGGIAAIGGDVPILDGGETPEPVPTTTATPTPNPTATATTTATPTPTPTATPSAEERRQMQLEGFQEDYLHRLQHTMENDSLTGVPVLGSDFKETENGTLKLRVVFWECDFAEGETKQWLNAGTAFVNTAGPHDKAQPDRLQLYAVTNLTNFNDEITYIQTSEAEYTYNRTRKPAVYTENYMDRRQKPSEAENETAYEIAVEDSGQEVADRAFYNDHADGRDAFKCNGGATIGDGNADD